MKRSEVVETILALGCTLWLLVSLLLPVKAHAFSITSIPFVHNGKIVVEGVFKNTANSVGEKTLTRPRVIYRAQ